MAKLTILSYTKPAAKPVLIIGANESQRILEVGEVTRQVEYVNQKIELTQREKKKGKDIATSEPQKKKVNEGKNVEFIKTRSSS